MDPEEPGNPYTHWAYFEDEVEARNCVTKLPEYLVKLDPPSDGVDVWLLRACRNVPVDRLIERHREVEHIVLSCGGDYDGGETTFLEESIVVDPALTEQRPRTSLLAGRIILVSNAQIP